jgi:Ca2+-binding EF-hand superfamily protein
MDTTAAASTLTRQRLSVAVLSLAATATLGYFCYRVYNPPLPEPLPDRRLHRSNAVRHRRRSLPDVVHSHGREPSEASTTSVESHADENVDVNTVRPLNDAETVADEHVLEDNWYDDGNNQFGGGQHQRAGQNIVSLLFRVSEDNARRNAYVHRGCLCNGCGITPIRGIRYRCANCTDFDLCETCESQGLHTKTHIFYKIRVPVPRLGSRPLQPVWYPGDPENCLRLLPKHLMARLSKETGFERPELEALWEQWTFMANTEWREDPDELGLAMDRRTFERYLVPSGGYRHIAPNLLHDRMFAFYDDNNDDLIGFSEFLHATAYRKRKDRLRKVFKGYDIDDDGYISRRDCLRLFRAYYVVFKHMHRDILDGLDDQVMSSTEVEQLVTSRQPLSSLFGREGGFNQADTDRPMQGKVINLNTGDVHITDGATSALTEDTPDTADRQSVLTSVFTSQANVGESIYMPVLDNSRPAGERPSGIEYLNGLLNPPTRINELPALLLGETRDGDDFLLVVNGGGQHSGNDGEQRAGDESPHGVGESGTSGSGGDGVGSGAGANESSDNGEAGSGQQAPPQLSYRVTSGRRSRANARRKLFDRWKRRQFYLDEEEGVLPPDDWSDDDDVLANLTSSADSKAAQPPLSSRSRSSSKVRFAEDTDDFDIRSNPSTSSRSIPERWGGMEIPDAERDVGKEIFYQVSQQAFNEILDTLFKSKEDLAVQAAETKELRDKYRPAFESINPDEEEETEASPASPSGNHKSPQDQSLQELLAASGYTVDPSSVSHTNARAEGEAEGNEDNETSDDDDDSVPPTLIPDDAEARQRSSPEAEVYRDPTMPQFRPDSVSVSHGREAEHSQPQVPPTATALPKEEEKAQPSSSPTDSQKSIDSAAEAADNQNGRASSKPISRSTLVNWKRLDLAEEEAKERGGWGRLSYEEFERIYKAAESNGLRLDYLGTWIDFCIPST